MIDIFQKRRAAFTAQNFKYLRYVFNDHFVLVLVFLMGFVMVQYSSLLAHFPSNHLPIIVLLLLAIAVLLSLGSIATYVEPADKHFLLTKEAELVQWVQKATRRSFVIWGLVQTLVLLFLAPLFFKLGLTVPVFLILLVVVLVLKWFVLQRKSRVFFSAKSLNWEVAIAYETKRQQSILKFFSLFTTVKGISTSVKRRKYLDALLGLVQKNHSHLWSNLYLRAFLRSSDYLGLTLRLLLLSLLALIFISQTYLAVALTAVFNYLLLFQLLALCHHYDYNYLSTLFPVQQDLKVKNLKQFLRLLLICLAVVEMFASLSWRAAALLFILTLLMTEVYLPYKLKKMID